MASSPTTDTNDPQQPPFTAALTRKLILSSIEKQTKISNEAADLCGELLRLFVSEAKHLASIQAECEQESHDVNDSDKKTRIQPHHITKIGADLLMDFMMG
ncbi:hypothetical protein MPSEU_000324000 [Mayamaea pseudoterrestris]|nr:hypothetical protein MPSEU_000324000 [Mayamaea pseudoterrestris]